ncbi:uncharacterized protein LOC132182749 [Corylus avellana]|uniref:uncharacterized protein LOC132182749 n=1 Tax=Corylus avellana TaxID=13451 RepID=UPI001E214895|nr:uncharacterized protein LOC132182749 [Corylus avellana]
MEVIRHFSHEEHPMIFVKEFGGEGVCLGCNKSVCAPAYICSHCNFFLHKSCAELSTEIQHLAHPNHTLLLQKPSESKLCDACRRDCDRCFFYHCNSCDFDIDIECASKSNTDDGHQHEFVPIFQQIHFTCELCGEDRNSAAQVCRICQLLVDTLCTQMPRTIKIMADRHLLTLIYSLAKVIKEHDDHVFCKLCYKQIKLKYAGYYCQQCDFVAHLSCAHKNRIGANDIILSSIEEEGTIFKEGEELEELKHFYHEHNLFLSRNQVEVHHEHKLCEGCMQSISPPLYTCEQCDYFLHSKCARLPLKKQDPTHPHLLTLYQFGFHIGDTVGCNACRRLSHGFAYACLECNYSLDIRCCLIMKTLQHEGHQHSLFHAINSVQECNSCGEGPKGANGVFLCKECNFALGFECATLPLKVEYELDRHPLLLTYTAENDYEDCYCLICEKERNPNQWFYYCEKCDFAAHPRCIVGRHPYIKYGRDFTWPDHQHPLNFVRRTEDSRPCDSCGEIFDEDVAINCTQCKSFIHLWIECMKKFRIK